MELPTQSVSGPAVALAWPVCVTFNHFLSPLLLLQIKRWELVHLLTMTILVLGAQPSPKYQD